LELSFVLDGGTSLSTTTRRPKRKKISNFIDMRKAVEKLVYVTTTFYQRRCEEMDGYWSELESVYATYGKDLNAPQLAELDFEVRSLQVQQGFNFLLNNFANLPWVCEKVHKVRRFTPTPAPDGKGPARQPSNESKFKSKSTRFKFLFPPEMGKNTDLCSLMEQF
jgi:hypothetical protein